MDIIEHFLGARHCAKALYTYSFFLSSQHYYSHLTDEETEAQIEDSNPGSLTPKPRTVTSALTCLLEAKPCWSTSSLRPLGDGARVCPSRSTSSFSTDAGQYLQGTKSWATNGSPNLNII